MIITKTTHTDDGSDDCQIHTEILVVSDKATMDEDLSFCVSSDGETILCRRYGGGLIAGMELDDVRLLAGKLLILAEEVEEANK